MSSTVRTLVQKRTNTSSVLRRIAIVGGTHGNELTGVSMVNFFENNPAACSRQTFDTTCIHANIDAIKQCTRYVDSDLNRCFDSNFLEKARNSQQKTSEMKRCLEIDSLLGPKFSTENPVDMVFDLHSTTSNCAVLLCFHKDDEFSRQVAAYLKSFDSNICCVYWPQDDPPFLPTIGRSGMTIEVGPVSHGTLVGTIYKRTFELLQRALDYIELHNRYVEGGEGNVELKHVKLHVARRVGSCDFPRDSEGRLTAMIHPDIQGIQELSEGKTIQHGTNVFMTLGGESIKLDVEKVTTIQDEPLSKTDRYYPMFVSEAAYYEKGVAFYLTKISEYNVPVLLPKGQSKL